MELEHKLVLTVRTKKPSNMGPKERQIIQDALNLRFKDAAFEIKEMTKPFEDWNPNQLTPSLRKTFDTLIEAKDFTLLNRTKRPATLVMKLRAKLPNHFQIISAAKKGYKLVDLREKA